MLTRFLRIMPLFVIQVQLLIYTPPVLANTRSIDSLLKVMPTVRSDSDKVNILIQISRLYQETNHSRSLDYAHRAVVVAEGQDDLKVKLKALNYAGNSCFHLGLLDQSVNYLLRGASIAEENNEQESLGKIYFNLGNVRLLLKDFDKAEAMYRKGYGILKAHYQDIGKPLSELVRCSYHNNLGQTYLQRKMYSEGEEQFLLALDIARKAGLTGQVLNASSGYADLLIQRKEYEVAIRLLEEVIRDSRQANDNLREMTALKLIGNACLEKGETSKALISYRTGYDKAVQFDVLAMKTALSEALYDLFSRTNKADSALKYQQLLASYQAEVDKSKAREEMMRSELLAEFRKKEEQLKEKQRSRTVTIAIVIIILTSITGAAGFYTWYTRKKYKQEVLTRMEARMEAEKTRLENEHLLAELDKKDKELSDRPIYAQNTKGMSDKIVHEAGNVQSSPADPTPEKVSTRELKFLTKSGRQLSWEDFEMRFRQAHPGFHERLKSVCPDLTPNERRLCCFLRLDLSTKEICIITGQSVKAVTQARIRLRQKLNLTHSETELHEFLAGI